MKRSRLRFTLRTLAIVVTLVCCYVACWEPTKTQGLLDVKLLVDKSADGLDDITVSSREFIDVAPQIPLLVSVTRFRSPVRVSYYFWCFGFVGKLPCEREISGL